MMLFQMGSVFCIEFFFFLKKKIKINKKSFLLILHKILKIFYNGVIQAYVLI
jgi:hypothetical protein